MATQTAHDRGATQALSQAIGAVGGVIVYRFLGWWGLAVFVALQLGIVLVHFALSVRDDLKREGR